PATVSGIGQDVHPSVSTQIGLGAAPAGPVVTRGPAAADAAALPAVRGIDLQVRAGAAAHLLGAGTGTARGDAALPCAARFPAAAAVGGVVREVRAAIPAQGAARRATAGPARADAARRASAAAAAAVLRVVQGIDAR